MKAALLQLNYTVGDIRGNAARVMRACEKAAAMGADLMIASELALTGYPPRDLLLDQWFVDAASRRLRELAQELKGYPPLLVGLPVVNPSPVGNPLFNAAALVLDGEIKGEARKILLPSYDVFDEKRYFQPGDSLASAEINGRKIGVTVCEDIWNDKDFWSDRRYYDVDPVQRLVQAGVDLIINISASPFTLGKRGVREKMLSNLAAKHKIDLLYVNQVGGNDDLVFDGRSMALDPEGRVYARAESFAEDVLLVDLKARSGKIAPDDPAPEDQAWRALVLGTRDYVQKCGFSRAVIGLSGGVDSSLCAAVAAEGLGADNVLGVLMPSPYSSRGSIDDASDLAGRLGIETLTLPIRDIMSAFDRTLKTPFTGLEPDVTEENIQSRIRGNLLMALSNKLGGMLLTTGNKSELSVGYCTIYGDMAGGLGVIADLPKTLVYSVCRWLNRERGQVIPRAVLDKPPSAELRPDQTDQDSLPPYDVLDEILRLHIEEHASLEQIAKKGFDLETVGRVLKLVRISEFKRRQAPPGLKITDRAFGVGWRMPVARKPWC